MELWQKIVMIVMGVIILVFATLFILQIRATSARDLTISGLEQDLRAAVTQVHTPEATTSIFRVTEPVRAGTLFNPNVVEVIQMPVSHMSPAYITDPELLRNAIWRIGLEVFGHITYDMLAFEPIFPTDRFHIIMVNAVTPSLELGDFVDIRMITPDGMDFIVLPKKRVVNIYDSGLEMILSEAEWMIYIGALIDQFMHRGTILYASKYVDPALQPRLYSTYIPPREIVDFMNINRNMLFPYREGMDIEGMRAFIESTQPWHRYASTMFNSHIQMIRQREQQIGSALQSQVGAMNIARQEFSNFMRSYYEAQGRVWQGGSIQHSQVATSGVAGGSGQGVLPQGQTGAGVTQVNPDGTWRDAGGTLRRPDGTPVIQDSDIIGWSPNLPDEADITYEWDFTPNIPSLGGN
jgi:hypothetical protein